ncbi:uncharacterized protein LOC108097058 [Drosophila ficusphila]|uniref:uncharacterized protein LOC108097058 n=1 Tax=Drosophila ficusphila TaxID=30025 RepID=UPI0007E6C28B|nr:uncharacterized protein LOC108097058 [Drosophila ficusphila]
MAIPTTFLLLLLACAGVTAVPMLYKLNPEEVYEPDLVAVSSTVIPLTVLEVSYGAGGKPSEEYKAAYLRKLRKQVLQRADKGKPNDEEEEAPTILGLSDSTALVSAPADADALITVKSQQLERAKVKAA